MNPYPLLFRLAITPWSRDEVSTRVAEAASERTSAGKALDLGCGTGRDAVYLAERGWTVTGIDGVKRALDGARQRSQRAGVDVNWILRDVTQLETAGLEDWLRLRARPRLLPRPLGSRARAMRPRSDERHRAGLTALLFAFQPRRLGLGPRGVTAEDVQGKFGPTWDMVSVTPETDLDRLPPWLGNPHPTWYLLARTA